MEVDLKCRKCGRWLGKANADLAGVIIKCGNCKTNNAFSVTFTSTLRQGLCYYKSRTDLSEATGKGQSKTAGQRKAERSEVNNE